MNPPNPVNPVDPVSVLIAGVSTRAAAESAARAGFVVTAIDAFGDLDQHPSVRGLSLAHNFTARAAALAAQRIECDAVVYLSTFENHPNAITTLAEGRALWGNPPETVRRVRDPLVLAEALRARGFATPAVRLPSPSLRPGKPDTTSVNDPSVTDPSENNMSLNDTSCNNTSVNDTSVKDTSANDTSVNDMNRKSYVESGFSRTVNQWLVKPLASGGGQRIRFWDRATSLPRGCYLQEFIDGPSGSVVFVAAGGRAVPFGVSRQLVGEPAFGAEGFQYCGNILTAAPRDNADNASEFSFLAAASALAQAVVDEFGLVGVNGIDFIVREGSPCAIEVNPRWCASMELVERAYGLSVFGAHAQACAAGALPEFDLARARRCAGAIGKAVVFARRDVVAGDTRAWLADPSVRDVPHPRERIRAGRPVCTVFAGARDAASCYNALVDRAERVYAELALWEREVA